METDTPENQSASGRGEGHGRGVAVGVAIVVFVMLAAVLGLPGFAAGWLSKGDPNVIFSINGRGCWDMCAFSRGKSARYNAGIAILTPSSWVMQRSGVIHKLYNWEYRCAGGVDITSSELFISNAP